MCEMYSMCESKHEQLKLQNSHLVCSESFALYLTRGVTAERVDLCSVLTGSILWTCLDLDPGHVVTEVARGSCGLR